MMGAGNGVAISAGGQGLARAEEHDPEVVRMLTTMAAGKRELAAVREQNADNHATIFQLQADLANEREARKQTEDALHRIADERDFYMRQAVQLRTQLNNAAALLSKDADEASKVVYGRTERPSAEGMTARLAQLADIVEAETRT
jgi:hypothetical protein